jgi:hypothetical protein
MKVVVVVIQDTADQGGGTLSLSLSHLLFSWNMMEGSIVPYVTQAFTLQVEIGGWR